MANTIAGVAIIPGSALGMAMITIVGQCVGADDEKQMRYYTKKLMLIAYGALFVLNIAVMLGLDGLIWIYNLELATGAIARTAANINLARVPRRKFVQILNKTSLTTSKNWSKPR